MGEPHPRHRELEVPDVADGMRLDRFLAARFKDRSRSELARGIRDGEVTDAEGQRVRASRIVRTGEVYHLFVEGIAPAGPPPPFPPILHEDDRLVVIDKPPGLMCHPSGTRYVYALIGLAKMHWPDERVDLVHRLDADTTGVLVLSKDLEANRVLSAHMREGACTKVYQAIAKGVPDWEDRVVEAPIGRAGGEIRIQMGVRPDGQSARTDVRVLERHPTAPLTRLECRLHTGRTHQIRVHCAHVGLPLLGDRLYGVPEDVFLTTQDEGVTDDVLARAGAARHALHARRITLPHPDGGELTVEAPLPDDMVAWWDDPSALPWDPER